MKSVILYSSNTASFDHQEIRITDGNQQVPLYIRSEVVDCDVSCALDFATPREGETVLNAIPISL